MLNLNSVAQLRL